MTYRLKPETREVVRKKFLVNEESLRKAEERPALTLFRNGDSKAFEGGYSISFYSTAWGRWVSLLLPFEEFVSDGFEEEGPECIP